MAAGLVAHMSGLSLTARPKPSPCVGACHWSGLRGSSFLQGQGLSTGNSRTGRCVAAGSLVIVAAQNAKKRQRTSERQRQYNKARKSAVGTRSRKVIRTIADFNLRLPETEADLKPVDAFMAEAYQEIDKADDNCRPKFVDSRVPLRGLDGVLAEIYRRLEGRHSYRPWDCFKPEAFEKSCSIFENIAQSDCWQDTFRDSKSLQTAITNNRLCNPAKEPANPEHLLQYVVDSCGQFIAQREASAGADTNLVVLFTDLSIQKSAKGRSGLDRLCEVLATGAAKHFSETHAHLCIVHTGTTPSANAATERLRPLGAPISVLDMITLDEALRDPQAGAALLTSCCGLAPIPALAEEVKSTLGQLAPLWPGPSACVDDCAAALRNSSPAGQRAQPSATHKHLERSQRSLVKAAKAPQVQRPSAKQANLQEVQALQRLEDSTGHRPAAEPRAIDWAALLPSSRPGASSASTASLAEAAVEQARRDKDACLASHHHGTELDLADMCQTLGGVVANLRAALLECHAGEMMRYAQDQAIARAISEERQQRCLADVRDHMRAALLTSFNQIMEQHKNADDSRPAQMAGHILLHFWIGASAAGGRESAMGKVFLQDAKLAFQSLMYDLQVEPGGTKDKEFVRDILRPHFAAELPKAVTALAGQCGLTWDLETNSASDTEDPQRHAAQPDSGEERAAVPDTPDQKGGLVDLVSTPQSRRKRVQGGSDTDDPEAIPTTIQKEPQGPRGTGAHGQPQRALLFCGLPVTKPDPVSDDDDDDAEEEMAGAAAQPRQALAPQGWLKPATIKGLGQPAGARGLPRQASFQQQQQPAPMQADHAAPLSSVDNHPDSPELPGMVPESTDLPASLPFVEPAAADSPAGLPEFEPSPAQPAAVLPTVMETPSLPQNTLLDSQFTVPAPMSGIRQPLQASATDSAWESPALAMILAYGSDEEQEGGPEGRAGRAGMDVQPAEQPAEQPVASARLADVIAAPATQSAAVEPLIAKDPTEAQQGGDLCRMETFAETKTGTDADADADMAPADAAQDETPQVPPQTPAAAVLAATDDVPTQDFETPAAPAESPSEEFETPAEIPQEGYIPPGSSYRRGGRLSARLQAADTAEAVASTAGGQHDAQAIPVGFVPEKRSAGVWKFGVSCPTLGHGDARRLGNMATIISFLAAHGTCRSEWRPLMQQPKETAKKYEARLGQIFNFKEGPPKPPEDPAPTEGGDDQSEDASEDEDPPASACTGGLDDEAAATTAEAEEAARDEHSWTKTEDKAISSYFALQPPNVNTAVGDRVNPITLHSLNAAVGVDLPGQVFPEGIEGIEAEPLPPLVRRIRAKCLYPEDDADTKELLVFDLVAYEAPMMGMEVPAVCREMQHVMEYFVHHRHIHKGFAAWQRQPGEDMDAYSARLGRSFVFKRLSPWYMIVEPAEHAVQPALDVAAVDASADSSEAPAEMPDAQLASTPAVDTGRQGGSCRRKSARQAGMAAAEDAAAQQQTEEQPSKRSKAAATTEDAAQDAAPAATHTSAAMEEEQAAGASPEGTTGGKAAEPSQAPAEASMAWQSCGVADGISRRIIKAATPASASRTRPKPGQYESQPDHDVIHFRRCLLVAQDHSKVIFQPTCPNAAHGLGPNIYKHDRLLPYLRQHEACCPAWSQLIRPQAQDQALEMPGDAQQGGAAAPVLTDEQAPAAPSAPVDLRRLKPGKYASMPGYAAPHFRRWLEIPGHGGRKRVYVQPTCPNVQHGVGPKIDGVKKALSYLGRHAGCCNEWSQLLGHGTGDAAAEARLCQVFNFSRKEGFVIPDSPADSDTDGASEDEELVEPGPGGQDADPAQHETPVDPPAGHADVQPPSTGVTQGAEKHLEATHTSAGAGTLPAVQATSEGPRTRSSQASFASQWQNLADILNPPGRQPSSGQASAPAQAEQTLAPAVAASQPAAAPAQQIAAVSDGHPPQMPTQGLQAQRTNYVVLRETVPSVKQSEVYPDKRTFSCIPDGWYGGKELAEKETVELKRSLYRRNADSLKQIAEWCILGG
ncbi:hypothetical protein WJX73_008204 [Symbiochloris irregularis]|uniref:Uncharacterized protein n=1 Tax=Symbiochloris irregularis TaxID=706552 RepID=A0AAW1PBZ3_9CHLO